MKDKIKSAKKSFIKPILLLVTGSMTVINTYQRSITERDQKNEEN